MALVWEESAVRETALRLADTETAEALRHVGRRFIELQLEAATFSTDALSPRVELEAVVADLRHLEGFLLHVVVGDDPMAYTAQADQRLALQASAWAQHLAGIAATIDAALSAEEA